MVFIIFRTIDFNSVGEMIARADLRWVVVIVVLAIADRYLMAYKWAVMLRAQGVEISNLEAFRVYMSSTFVGVVLPTSVGNDVYRAVRATLGGRQMKVVTTSIVLERVLGMLAVTLLSLVGLAILAIQQPDARFDTLLAAVITFAIVILILLRLSIHPKTYATITGFIEKYRRFKPVSIFMDLHGAYMEYSRQGSVLGAFFALSVVEQSLSCFIPYLSSRALGLDTPLIFFLTLIPLSRFITLLPISIGGIGVTEGTYVFVFMLAGMTDVQALSVAVFVRLIGWVMLLPTGAVFLYDSIKFKRQREAAIE